MAVVFDSVLQRAERLILPQLDRFAAIGVIYATLKRTLEVHDGASPPEAQSIALKLTETMLAQGFFDRVLRARVPALEEVVSKPVEPEHPLPLGQNGQDLDPFAALRAAMAQTQQTLDKDEGESVTQVGGSGPNVVWRSDEEIAAAESEAEERGPFAFSGWGSPNNTDAQE